MMQWPNKQSSDSYLSSQHEAQRPQTDLPVGGAKCLWTRQKSKNDAQPQLLKLADSWTA